LNQQQQQQGTTMTADRHMLAEKELLYIQDFLSWELLAMKRCKHAADAAQDAEIKGFIQSIGQKHKQHYETILTHLH
jgi:hypothetical protein